ncbi:four helix bundle protein [Clostridium tertium]|uniref:Four helix bundle protein n=1 Tax=Clostridium tertium TaxID=1559 RepID=A0A6N3E2T5_9CLOT
MKNAILDKSFNFSLDIVKLYLKLKNEKEYILSKQLVRSATSIGANVTEAQYAQSKKDFISKMSIALKEANESEYWINLLIKAIPYNSLISQFLNSFITSLLHYLIPSLLIFFIFSFFH